MHSHTSIQNITLPCRARRLRAKCRTALNITSGAFSSVMPVFFRWWRGMNTHTLRVHQGSTFPYKRRKAAQSEKRGKDNSKQATIPFSQLSTVACISVQYYQWNKLMQAQIRAMTRCQHPFQYISTNTKAPGTKHFEGFTWGT